MRAAKYVGVSQSSFQLVVREADTGAAVWDSGVVPSPEARHVAFGSVGNAVGPVSLHVYVLRLSR
jgi:hypothetical protein